MKINPRHYPTIILTAFVLFLLLGFLLRIYPQTRRRRGRSQSSADNGVSLARLSRLRLVKKPPGHRMDWRHRHLPARIAPHIMPGETSRGGSSHLFVPLARWKRYYRILPQVTRSRPPTCSTFRSCSACWVWLSWRDAPSVAGCVRWGRFRTGSPAWDAA